ncbi:hypothetical protein FOCG_17703 [Fusarium oxysporum f. sp. radicis-lycopersici 26381]|nr:hypothetical protein FOCG_17703 [Fusarium oxysporum f. sp. radicis-lycopersici 26381]
MPVLIRDAPITTQDPDNQDQSDVLLGWLAAVIMPLLALVVLFIVRIPKYGLLTYSTNGQDTEELQSPMPPTVPRALHRQDLPALEPEICLI